MKRRAPMRKKYYEIYRIKKIMESEGSGVYIFLQSSKSLAGLVPIGDAADETKRLTYFWISSVCGRTI